MLLKLHHQLDNHHHPHVSGQPRRVDHRSPKWRRVLDLLFRLHKIGDDDGWSMVICITVDDITIVTIIMTAAALGPTRFSSCLPQDSPNPPTQPYLDIVKR